MISSIRRIRKEEFSFLSDEFYDEIKGIKDKFNTGIKRKLDTINNSVDN